MDFIEEKLSMLDACEDQLKEMPCGDERAEKVVLIDRARREIMQIEGNGNDPKIEKRLNNLMEKL